MLLPVSDEDEMSVMEVFAMALLVATELDVKLTGLAYDETTTEFCFATRERWHTVMFLKKITRGKTHTYFHSEFRRAFCNTSPTLVSPVADDNGGN